MRKIPVALVALALASVSLVGCSASSGAAACPRPESSTGALDKVTVSGTADAAPDVEVYSPFRTDQTEFEDVITGDGTAITSDAQLVVFDLTIIGGADGRTLVASAYDGDLSQVASLERWGQLVPGFSDALTCATEGSRVVIGLAPGDVETETAVSLGLAEDDSAVAVVDVRKVYLPHADGANQFNSGSGLPTVVRAPDGRPGIIVPDADAPTELVVQTLKKGDGEEVTGDRPVRVHYTGVTWADRTVFDSTWDTTPASLTLDGVVPGMATALEGATVGSQLLIVIPPGEGYGDAAQGSIPANSTLVFVVDILGLDQAAPTE
ncbi:FKBP-type peptidyl-prolyl cis-trans isomerase [Microbacterium terricola]|uniref:peptidylprolyl isomerase n=1 Tax=Microbacterium terricola TaxID=344163 RepID=A0ABM8DYC3_9MICO|nr:FKBP-type peptidyl-prolyl cis-trans isomerase [Microbacterium terricola]UYK38787.1 FKBP-type peptidyl-prolyl cis-trans isomerase [Microbacterium terricola]BDV30520.1 peptidylprolyl isomerase [Microbacterium terricola]